MRRVSLQFVARDDAARRHFSICRYSKQKQYILVNTEGYKRSTRRTLGAFLPLAHYLHNLFSDGFSSILTWINEGSGTMNKNLVMCGPILFMFCIGLIATTPAFGISFSASDIVGGYTATGSANLDYSFTGYTLTIDVYNTSPLTDSGENSNSPAITSFGFDVSNLTGYTGFEVYAHGFILGGDTGSWTEITDLWELENDVNLQGGQGGKLKFDFVPNTENGIAGGLINPLADGSTGNDLYETKGTFTIVFAEDPGDLTNWHMRFQNLGLSGEGSLNKVPSIPDPAAVFLLGSACLMGGLAGFRRKFRK